MYKSFLVFFISLTFFAFSWNAMAQEVPSENAKVLMMLKQGDGGSLAGLFHSRVDLELPGSTGIYSQSQAEEILKTFFKNYPPTEFSLKHSGHSGEKAAYSIGQYRSGTHNFRVYYLLKPSGDKYLIHQLRFEKQS